MIFYVKESGLVANLLQIGLHLIDLVLLLPRGLLILQSILLHLNDLVLHLLELVITLLNLFPKHRDLLFIGRGTATTLLVF